MIITIIFFLQFFQEIETWKLDTYMKIDQIHNSIVEDDNIRASIEKLSNQNNIHIGKMKKIDTELKSLKIELSESLNESDQELRKLNDKIRTLDAVLLSQNNTLQ